MATLATTFDALNAHDPAAYAHYFTPNAIHKEAAAKDLDGRDEIERRMAFFLHSFPDLHIQVEHVWQRDAVVVASWKWNGTDRGGFVERPATNKHAGLFGVSVGFFNADGNIREIHMYEDGMTAFAQLDANSKAGSFRAVPEVPTGESPRIEAATNGPEEARTLAWSKSFYDALEAHDKSALAGLVADGAGIDDMALPAQSGVGKEGISHLLDSWMKTFGPFTSLPLYHHIAIGQTAIGERVLNGKMNGKPIKLHVVDIVEWKDGKIVRLASYSNMLELWAQLGPKSHR